MTWFVRNILFLHVLALVLAFSWIHGGTRADLLLPVIPWLALLVLQWLVVYPQAKSTETLVEARLRVWRALARDPLLYAALLLVVFLTIPLFNVARPPAYDAAAQTWHNFSPPVGWLPACTDPWQHAVLLLWFPPVLVAALAVRHGLLKKSKRLLLEAICWNGAALALLGFLQIYTGTNKVLWLTPMERYFFSVFGYPNFAGAFFTLTAALAAGLWFFDATVGLRASWASSSGALEEDSWLYTNRMAFPAVLGFVAAGASLSRAAIFLGFAVLFVLVVYMVAFVWSRVGTTARVTILSSLFAACMIVMASFAIFKWQSFREEARKITFTAVVERVTGKAYYHARVAKAILRDHPVFGVGGWGYGQYQLEYLTAADRVQLQIDGGVNVHNDSLQFLAEHGYVGYGVILACAALLVFPVFWQVLRLFRPEGGDWGGGKAFASVGWLQRIPIPVVAVAVGCFATVCHSFGDLPFRAPSVMIVWVLAWCAVPGWIPVLRQQA